MKYYVWSRVQDGELAWLKTFPEEFDGNSYLLNKGVTAEKWFPKNVVFKMAMESGMQVVDIVPNTLMKKIISEKVKDVLEEHSTSKCEFLPIKIKNHKGRLVEGLFYIANLLESVPCLDKNRSEFVIDALDKTQMDHISHLFLDEKMISEDIDLFRLSEMNTLFLIREDLVSKLKEAQISGLNFIELEEYGKQYRKISKEDRLEKIRLALGLK